MAVSCVSELEEMGSVELQYVSSDLLKFIYGSPEEQVNRTPLVRQILGDRRLRNLSLTNVRCLYDQASSAFEEIEKLLAERKNNGN